MFRVLLVSLCLAGAATVMAADAPKKPAAHAKPVKDAAMKQIDEMIVKAKVDKSSPNWKTQVPMPTVATFDKTHTYLAKVETNKGPIVIQFMPETAPMHVTSFIYLARMGFFDGLSFHRVIPGFMAQGGDPLGNGTGGPGYSFNGEFAAGVKHDRGGLLSMANAGPGTDASQFFLTFVETPWLDGKHTIFGKVIEGMETLKQLEAVGTPNGRTTEPVGMTKVTIEVK